MKMEVFFKFLSLLNPGKQDIAYINVYSLKWDILITYINI